MDDHRFDSLTRAFASGKSRRGVLKGLLGLGGAALAGGVLLEPRADAARRPVPTAKPLTCPGQQIPFDNQCVCPAGLDKCGPDCCPAEAECCDNACCYGRCYGEELCCPAGSIVCDGNCFPGDCCDDSDCGGPCQFCNSETRTCAPVAAGEACDGGVCNPQGSCVECNSAADCTNTNDCGIGICSDGICSYEWSDELCLDWGYVCKRGNFCEPLSCSSETIGQQCVTFSPGGEGICQENGTCCVPSGSFPGGEFGVWCEATNCCIPSCYPQLGICA